MLDSFLSDLINKFNEEGNLLFHATKYEQQFYDNDIKDQDGRPYVATIINELEMPIITDFYTTRKRMFELSIKVQANLENEVKTVLKNSVDSKNSFKANDRIYQLGELIVSEPRTEDYGKDKIKVIYGSIRVSVDVPVFITGNDITVSIDSVPVNVIRANETHDKALLSSVAFGDNTSDINTGSEHIYTFGLEAGTTNLFTDVKNNTFNKSYEFSFNYGVMEQDITLVLRRGVVNWGSNNDTVTFTCVFERALPRKEIKIDGHQVNAINFTPQYSLEPLPINRQRSVKLYGGTFTKMYSFYIENDNSELIQTIIEEFRTPVSRGFDIEFKINNTMINAECILVNLVIPSGENPNAVFNLTFGEKA